jgi:ABC-type uncharacterized transport system involved in gliding motility auxiliary subunit
MLAVAEVDKAEAVAVHAVAASAPPVDARAGDLAALATAASAAPASAPEAATADAAPAEETPVQPAAPAVAPKAGGKVAVLGDSDIAANDLLLLLQDQDLVLNLVAWMVGEEDQVSIRPNEAAHDTLTMTAGRELVVWLTSVFLAPGVALAGALGTWLKRRAL